MAPGQKANGDNLESVLDLLYNTGLLCVHIRITSSRRF